MVQWKLIRCTYTLYLLRSTTSKNIKVKSNQKIYNQHLCIATYSMIMMQLEFFFLNFLLGWLGLIFSWVIYTNDIAREADGSSILQWFWSDIRPDIHFLLWILSKNLNLVNNSEWIPKPSGFCCRKSDRIILHCSAQMAHESIKTSLAN